MIRCMTVPILIKLLVSLVLIIVLNRLTHKLHLALLGGAVVFSLWIGLGIVGTLEVAARSLFSFSTLGLASLVSLVIILSLQMEKTGMVHRLVRSIRSAFSPRASLAIIPAVIGLLPMPGGALFSAPLLDNFDDLEGIDGSSKTNINYWFRHVWEYAWPLYPGVIVACVISGIELWQFFLFGFPLSIVSILIGRYFFLRKVGNVHATEHAKGGFSVVPFLPILTVVILYGTIQFLLPSIATLNQYLPMVVGLLGAITILQAIKPLGSEGWKAILSSRQIGKMLLIILMVRVYGSYIEADIGGMSVVRSMADEMQRFGIPTLPLIMLLPFFTGMTMGVSVGFSATSMPVVVALLGPAPEFGILMGTVLFAYVSGFMGTMLSPLHVCMIVTVEYYKTELLRSYRPVVIPVLFMIASAFAYMLLLRIVV